MAYRESRGSRILLSLGLLVFASSFCHCTKLTKLKALDELRENSTLGKSQAKAGDLRYGRLLIGQNSLPDDKLNGTKATKNFWDVDTDYQEDMGWGNPEQLQRLGYGFSKPDNAAVERLLLMDPKVECTGDSMKLQVQNAASTPGSLFFVDRGSLMSPLALSKLPPSCGYNIRSTRRDLVLVAPYDGCFVVLEEDSYVLPIRWLGLNVRMSCPLMPSSPNPPMVTCHAEGMVVKTGWTVSIAEININLNGNWEPLMKASSRCGFSVVVHPEGVVISVHYTPCMEIKDGMYTLELAGEGETKMSCPPLPWPPASGAPQQQPFYPQLEAEKQTAEPRPVWTKAPQGKVQPPFYLYPFYPQPVTEKPTAAPRPPQTEAPQGPVQPLFYPQPETEKPTAAPRPPQTEAPQGPVQPLFYPQPETEKPTAAPRPPQTKAPQGKVQPPFYLYPFYPQPVTEKPTADPRPPQTEAPQGPVQPPFYPQPETEKPTAAPRPPQTKAPQGQVRLPFYPYPFYPQPETEKPTADPRPPQTEAPQGPVQTLFYPQPETEKPTADPRPPQTKAPQGKVQPPFYLYPFYPQPVTEKPTADPRPPQTEAPQGQVRLPFYPYPFYPQPETEKPTADPRPPQTEAPQGPVQPPFYPQPETEKPTAAPRPPQTKAPQGKVQPPFYLYPFYPQPETEKPTAAPRPPQTKAPQGQVRLQFYPYPFYPQPETEKPTADPRPPQTEAPQGPVQTLFYSQPETEKPTADPRPPQTKAPQGKVQPPFYLYPFYPQPETEKPTADPRPPQTEAPQGPVQPPFYPQPETEKPTAAPRPPQTKAPQGKVQPPFYLYPFYPQPETEKPTAAQRPPQTKAPQGQVRLPFYPYPFYPQPETEKPTADPRPPQTEAPQGPVQTLFYPQPETEKPTADPRPPQTKAPQGKVQPPFYLYPFYPQPVTEKPTADPRPPQTEAPQGQVRLPFYPYPFYPQPETEKPTADPRPPQTEAPQGPVQPLFYPQPETEKPTAAPRPPQTKAPQGQVRLPFYPFYPQPETEKPTADPRPPQTEAPQGPVQPLFYPQPETEKPTAAPRPPQTKAPQGKVQPPFYLYPQPVTEKPTAAPRPPQTKAPQGKVQPPFYIYHFYPQPETEKPVTSPPATTMQQPQPVITLTSEQPPLESDFPQPSNSDVVPQDPQQGSPYMRPVSCPQFCLSGISNCCPQIAFHQHHHHIIPSGLGSKDAPSLYPGLPFPQLAYSGFHSSLDSGPLPQKPTKMMMQATPTATIAQSQYLPYPQPPDGNPAILNYPSKPARFEQPLYPFVPNSLYPYWQYLPQNEALQRLPQSQSPAHYNVHSKRHTPGSEPVNPVLQYNKPSPMQQNGQLAWDINNSSGPDFMSHIGKYLNQQQNTPKAGELQQSNEASKSRLMHPKVKSETDRPLVPYNMLQDAKAQTYDKLTPNNASQPEDQQTVHSYVEPKSYVLLQHGPPDRGSNHSNESPLPSRDLVYDADLKAQNLARHHSSKLQDSQNVKPPQNPQHPKMLGQEMSHPLLDVNYIPRPDDKSSLPFISLDDPHSVPLPQDPFVNGAHLNPKFKDFWRPMTPLGSSQSIEPHVLVKAFQQSSAADQQADGLNQPNQPILQRGGNQRQK